MKAYKNIIVGSSRSWVRLLVILTAMVLLGWILYHNYHSNKTKEPQNHLLEVTVVPAELKQISNSIFALGTAIANESVDISANVTDIITKFSVSDGQKVKKGDIIAELKHDAEDTELASIKATVIENERELERLKKLVVGGNISRQQMDLRVTQLEVSKHKLKGVEAQIAHRVIRAPFEGIVGVRKLSVGALVQPGQVITTIDDISKIKLDFTIPSQHLAKLSKGQEVIAQTEAIMDEIFVGKVKSIDTRIDPVSRSVLVRAVIPNPNLKLKPGLLMKVNLIESKYDALMVHEESVIGRGHEHFVYVIKDNIAYLNKVDLGERIPGFVEIKSGIQKSDLVVTRGIINLCNGQKVSAHQAIKET